MEINVRLSIRGQQTVDNEEPEVTELITEGVLSSNGEDHYTLRYQESELTGLEGTQTTFQIEKGRVTLLREGRLNSQLVFEEGRNHLSMYNTPYGSLAIGVNTSRMKVHLDENGGEIEISYAIEIDHAMASENLFHIRVQKAARS